MLIFSVGNLSFQFSEFIVIFFGVRVWGCGDVVVVQSSKVGM